VSDADIRLLVAHGLADQTMKHDGTWSSWADPGGMMGGMWDRVSSRSLLQGWGIAGA